SMPQPAENAIEMLNAAETALECDFRAGAPALLQELLRPGDATPQDEVHDGGADLFSEQPHQRAGREIGRTRDRPDGEAFGEMRLNVGDRPAESGLGL